MVFLGTKLRLPIAEATEKHIMIAAHTRWEREGWFSWASSIDEELEEEDDRWLYDCDLPSDPKSDAFPAVYEAQVSEEVFRCITEDLIETHDRTAVGASEISQYMSTVDDTGFPNPDHWTSFDVDNLSQADSGDSCQTLATDSPDQQQFAEDRTWSNNFLPPPPFDPLSVSLVSSEEQHLRLIPPEWKIALKARQHKFVCSRCWGTLNSTACQLSSYRQPNPNDIASPSIGPGIIDEQQSLRVMPAELPTNKHNLDDITLPLTYSGPSTEAPLDPWIGGTVDTEPQYLDELRKLSRLLV
jgi:hypothetical protein